MLLECGADANDADVDANTPLHLLCAAATAATVPDQVRNQMETMIEALLAAGAHADCINKKGEIATKDLGTWWSKWRALEHLTLKCFAARVVKEYNIPYKGEVPCSLESFLEKH